MITYEVCTADLTLIGEVEFDAAVRGGYAFRRVIEWRGHTARYSNEHGVFILDEVSHA